MWYYGVLGSNEADYAWMDEGFASYADVEVTAHVADRPASHTGAHIGVLRQQHLDLFERMNTPADWFSTNSGYSNASYTAGEMLLDLLGYVISDSLRDEFLLEYFERYKFRHPNPFDMEKVAEDVSGIHLDWYFDQLTNSLWSADYAVDALISERKGEMWETTLELERESGAVLPVDVRLTLADGTIRWVNIPLSVMQGHKPVPEGWMVAEPWQWTFPEYTLRLELPGRVVRAEIDPLLRTPDANRLNNSSRLPIRTTFLHAPPQSWSTYQVGWRPLAQYADAFGFGVGVQLRGTYIFDRLSTRAMVKLWPEVLLSGGEEPEDRLLSAFAEDFSWHDGLDFDFALSDQVDVLGANTTLTAQTQKHLGIWQTDAAASFLLNKEDALTARERRLIFTVRHQKRTTDRVFITPASGGFSTNLISASARLVVANSESRLMLLAETGGALDSGTFFRNANRAYADLARGFPVGGFTATIQARVGYGSDVLAAQKAFRMGVATYEERWENDAYRTVAAIFEDPLEELHWEAFAGPGPVAYARRELPGSSSVVGAPIDTEIWAASARLLSPRAGRRGLAGPLRFEAFFGAGSMGSFEVFDAGLGIRYDVAEIAAISRWVRQSDVLSGMDLRLLFPIWASDPGLSDPIAFRWLMGVSIDDLPWE